MQFETLCPECDADLNIDVHPSKLDFFYDNSCEVDEEGECKECGCKWTMTITCEVELEVRSSVVTFKPQKKKEFDPFDVDTYGDSRNPNQLSLL